jgi:arabinogalactan endo-1,4-beta-galactosidase
MKRNNLLNTLALFSAFCLPLLSSCGGGDSHDWPSDGSVKFFYDEGEIVNTYGEKINAEVIDYDSLMVHRTTNQLRDDFAYGVDASMVYEVEENGGIYYNEDGKEQDIFQIMRNDGVNFVRFRIWNDPKTESGAPYGGGNNDLATDLAMAKRAKDAKLNVMIDFHYSDFWADPDTQRMPKVWQDLGTEDLFNAISEYTSSTLQAFKDAGVTVDAVQIGNEINNGFLFNYGKLNKSSETSRTNIATMISLGIDAAKSVFPHCYTVVHLAEGGQKSTFQQFFSELDKNGCDYDIIGASFYPYRHGTLDALQANLNNIVEVTGKPVMVMETAWGFTTDSNDYTANIYDESLEEAGGYLTSVQAQATCISDIADVLSKVPNQMGLGMFYWEPDRLPVANAGWATAAGQSYNENGTDKYASGYSDGKSSWSNQALFSYSGKALPSLSTYKYIKDGSREAEEKAVAVKNTSIDVTLNLAAKETMPTTYQVQTNFDALRNYPVTWNSEDLAKLDRAGSYVVRGNVNGVDVKANVTCELNYVKDPSYEEQASSTVSAPREVVSGGDYVKIANKSEGRTGTNDLNYYYAGGSFSFEVKQKVTGIAKGTYALRTYVEGSTSPATNKIYVYCKYGDQEKTYDLTDKIDGRNADDSIAFKQALISDIVIPEDDYSIDIGIVVEGATKEARGHIDDRSFAEQL